MDREARYRDRRGRGDTYRPDGYVNSHMNGSYPNRRSAPDRQSATFNATYIPASEQSRRRRDINGGNIPGAPRPPRQIDPAESSRNRSRSPRRESVARAVESYRERELMGPPARPPRYNGQKFADPFLNADRVNGRRPSQESRAYREIEYNEDPDHHHTVPKMLIKGLFENFKGLIIRPEDIPGQMFKDAEEKDARNFFRNVKTVLPGAIANLYNSKF